MTTLTEAASSVALATTARWRELGSDAHVCHQGVAIGDLGFPQQWPKTAPAAVVVSDANTVECVVDSATDWIGVCTFVSDLQESGWYVTVLTPLAVLGSAHQGLRGTQAKLQGYWTRENEIMFSPVELA